MKETERIIFKYDKNQDKFLVNDKEIEQDDWIKAKSTWECAQSYNHIKRYVDEWGFTSHDYYTEENVDVWVFTTVKR
jgi:hypothetical protein